MSMLHRPLLLAGSLCLALAATAPAMAKDKAIPKMALFSEVLKGLVLPAEASGQKPAATGFNLLNPKQITERRDSVAGNIQYMPIAQKDAPKGLKRSALTAALKEYLAANRAKFKLDPTTLVAADRSEVTLGHQVILSFHQQLSSAKVEMALVQATFIADDPANRSLYRLVDITNQTYGELDEATITAELRSLGDDPLFEQMAILDRQDVITPVYDNGYYTYKPGRRFLVEDQSTSKQYRVSVGNDGKMRHAISQFQAFQGEISATVFDRGYFNNFKTTFPLKHALIGDTFTSGTGFISLPDGDYTLNLFSGGQLGQAPIGNPERRINIIDFQGTSTPQGFSTPIFLSGGRADLGQLDDNDLTAVNTFVAINRVWDFALQHLDGATDTDGLRGNEVSFLSGSINVLVNQPIANQAARCNAFFNPNNNSLNFFIANAPCGNFGQLNDVIYHEWGHALDNSVGPTNGITDGAFSEGLSDVISGYFTGDARVAPGFTTNNLNGGLRNLNNNARLGDARLTGVHAQGTIIGGAFWDLRQRMLARHGVSGVNLAEKLFFQHLLITDFMTNSYTNVLRLDDDDGDLTNGTPNLCLINSAFARHGLTSDRQCQDAPPGLRVQVLDETPNGGLMLELSLPDDGTTPAICLGTEGNCIATSRRDINTRLVTNPLAGASGRRVFRTEQGVPVSGANSVGFSVLIINNGTVQKAERISLQSQ